MANFGDIPTQWLVAAQAPAQRVRFELDLGDDAAAAPEVVALLDDYAVYDLLAERPRCQYHSIFGTGLPMNGTSRVAKATVGTPETLRNEGGGALGDQPTVYNALVSAVVRPPRFLYEAAPKSSVAERSYVGRRRLRGISTPRRRRDPASPEDLSHEISTSRPRRRRDPASEEDLHTE